jgi:DNA-binding beta-propeller fold protein YncE
VTIPSQSSTLQLYKFWDASPQAKGAEGFDVSPDGKEIWVANAQDATVTIIDLAAKNATQTLPIPIRGANRLKFTPDGKRVLISGLGAGPKAGGSNLVVIDASSRKEVKELNLGGGAAGILVAPDGSRAYVAQHKRQGRGRGFEDPGSHRTNFRGETA